MGKVIAIAVIVIVLIGSLLVVFINTQNAQKIATETKSMSSSLLASNDPEQKADLIASNDVNSVDQIEASNLADDVALDPNQ